MGAGDIATWVGVIVALVVGVGGVVVGVVSLVVALRANRLAKAALVADDVWWSVEWNTPGAADLVNGGHDAAHQVRGHVTVDGETFRFGPIARVPGGQAVRLSFPDLRVALALERQRLDGPDDPLNMGYSIDAVAYHVVSWRVTWETTLGRTMPMDAQAFTEQHVTPARTTPPTTT